MLQKYFFSKLTEAKQKLLTEGGTKIMKKITILAILTFTCILAFGFNNFTGSQQAKQLPKWRYNNKKHMQTYRNLKTPKKGFLDFYNIMI